MTRNCAFLVTRNRFMELNKVKVVNIHLALFALPDILRRVQTNLLTIHGQSLSVLQNVGSPKQNFDYLF